MADSDPGNRLPETKYKTEYPYCQTHVSRSGHEKHIDDTPGHERIREGHKSGTYWEVTEDGRKVTLVVANEYHYVKGGLTLTIDNNEDIKVAGNYKLVVQGDLYQEVDGNSYTITKGNSTSVTLGNSTTMVGKDCFTKVKGSMSASVNGNLNTEVKGDAEISVKGDTSIVSTGDIDMQGQQIRISATGPCTIRGNPVNIVG
jgi:hypothetical protein